jgi:hypothetical protein
MKARVTPSQQSMSHDFADGEAVHAAIGPCPCRPVLGAGVLAGIGFTCRCSSRTSFDSRRSSSGAKGGILTSMLAGSGGIGLLSAG